MQDTTLDTALAVIQANLQRGELQEAARIIVNVLERLERKQAGFGTPDSPASTVEAAATRLATAITQLLSNPAYQPKGSQVRNFLIFKRVVSHIFEISAYRGTGRLLDLIAGGTGGDPGRLSGFDVTRLVMGISINAADGRVLDLLTKLRPAHALLALLAFLSEYLTWSPQAEAARSWILQSAPIPGDVKLWENEWGLLASAWMACSYADYPGKHNIKARLNVLVRNWLLSRGVVEAPLHRSLAGGAGRPTLLVIADIYRTGHAMDRCYRASLRSLKRHFRTVLMLASDDRGALDESLFDVVDRTPFETTAPERFLRRAQSYAPAIVYFPSVGMRIGSIACANVRLAPIQIASMGHPTSTRSSCVDYVVLSDKALGDPACFSEALLLRAAASHYVRHAAAPAIEPDVRRHPDPVRLAVPAWIRKLTPRFLATCRSIAQRAPRAVEFWFFPNVRGVHHQAARQRLKAELPARVFPTEKYRKYLANLNACDIHLSTFPFGSSNGIVDSAGQGLPVVNLVGPEPHSRIDAMLAGRLPQPEWLTVTTPEEYEAAVLRLVEDDALRVQISAAILRSDPHRQFLVADDAETEDFADIFYAAYQHHDAIRASGRKVWSYEELRCLDAGGRASSV